MASTLSLPLSVCQTHTLPAPFSLLARTQTRHGPCVRVWQAPLLRTRAGRPPLHERAIITYYHHQPVLLLPTTALSLSLSTSVDRYITHCFTQGQGRQAEEKLQDRAHGITPCILPNKPPSRPPPSPPPFKSLFSQGETKAQNIPPPSSPTRSPPSQASGAGWAHRYPISSPRDARGPSEEDDGLLLGRLLLGGDRGARLGLGLLLVVVGWGGGVKGGFSQSVSQLGLWVGGGRKERGSMCKCKAFIFSNLGLGRLGRRRLLWWWWWWWWWDRGG